MVLNTKYYPLIIWQAINLYNFSEVKLDPIQVAHELIKVLDDKKAEDILLLDIRSQFPFADYFIICSAYSERQISALVNAVIEKAHQSFNLPARVEGLPQGGWMLIDLVDVIVHIFSPEQRDYYKIEEVWNDAKTIIHLQ